ncbi:uncharacterized protein LOC112453333 [Temnothorax curvispinosus]|uniref:Uncharacterized protein LOC112453333 n=1 Tax=Temnothorax curvispinosus TaxID=300111 RepID=A0A6J1PKW5_9HYME|nr:uncharacterized protein LOC112453333 [Temnothorax curvispinosus]
MSAPGAMSRPPARTLFGRPRATNRDQQWAMGIRSYALDLLKDTLPRVRTSTLMRNIPGTRLPSWPLWGGGGSLDSTLHWVNRVIFALKCTDQSNLTSCVRRADLTGHPRITPGTKMGTGETGESGATLCYHTFPVTAVTLSVVPVAYRPQVLSAQAPFLRRAIDPRRRDDRTVAR